MALGLWDPHAGTIVPESHIPLWEWYLVPHQASGLLQGLRDACPGELTTLNHATPSPMHTSVLTRTCCWEMLGCTALANPHQAQDMQGPCAWGSAYHSCCTQVAIQLGRTEPQVWQEPRVARLPTSPSREGGQDHLWGPRHWPWQLPTQASSQSPLTFELQQSVPVFLPSISGRAAPL
jgi:hypothetical protein